MYLLLFCFYHLLTAILQVGDTLDGAISKAYSGIKNVNFEGMSYRKGIQLVDSI